MTDWEEARAAVLNRLRDVVSSDPRLTGLWLQGSLARGDGDVFSDIDAYIAIDAAQFDAVFAERAYLLSQVGPAIAWSDATTPGFKAVHALLGSGVKLDLMFESDAHLGAQERPPFAVLLDKGPLSALRGGYVAPIAFIGLVVATIIRMTRQGASWPLRLIGREQFSTLAMMELDLINAQLAQLMAVQIDPVFYFQNPFALSIRLPAAQRARLDALTTRALDALSKRNLAALKRVHLEVHDALVSEGRAACTALGVDYPLSAADDDAVRGLLEREWPS